MLRWFGGPRERRVAGDEVRQRIVDGLECVFRVILARVEHNQVERAFASVGFRSDHFEHRFASLFVRKILTGDHNESLKCDVVGTNLDRNVCGGEGFVGSIGAQQLVYGHADQACVSRLLFERFSEDAERFFNVVVDRGCSGFQHRTHGGRSGDLFVQPSG